MSARSFRRLVAVLAAVGVLAAACTTSRDDKTAKTSSGGGGKAAAASNRFPTTARGVTADTIKIGVSYFYLGPLYEAGIIKVDEGPFEQVAKVLVDDVNQRGGINGRKLELTVAKFFTPDNTSAAAACAQLTEDHEDFAVLGGFIGDQNVCVPQQHSTILVSGFSGYSKAQAAKARAPWVTWQASDERSLEALVKLLDQNGLLKGKKIGLYGQSADSTALLDLAAKTLKGAGYEVAESASNEVAATDTQAFNAQEKVIGTRFKDKGIDTVFVSGTTPGSNWDSIDFHPAMFLPTTSLIAAGAFTNPLEKFPLVAGAASTSDPQQNYDSPAMKECRALWQKATGVDVKTPTQETVDKKSSGFTPLQNLCTAMRIFVAAAEKAGKDLNQHTWQEGLESIGSIELPTGPASFGPDKPDGQDTFQLEKQDPTWTTSSSKPEFIPVGNPITLTR